VLSRTISISVGLILLIWLGAFVVSCHETERHKVLTFFFDGVGPLRPAGFEEALADPDLAQSPQEPLWYVHEPRKDCTLCHGKRGQKLFAPEAILIAPVPALCHNCHDDHTVSAPFVHGPVAVGQCLFCHHHHKSRIQYLLNEPEPKLCYQCHDINVIESMPAHLTVQPSACTDCHNPHRVIKNRLFNADEEGGGETAIPPVSPETPPAYTANPSPVTHPQPASPQPAPTLPSTSTEAD